MANQDDPLADLPIHAQPGTGDAGGNGPKDPTIPTPPQPTNKKSESGGGVWDKPESKWQRKKFVKTFMTVMVVMFITFVAMIFTGVEKGEPITWKTMTGFNLTSVGICMSFILFFYLIDSIHIVNFKMMAIREVFGEFEGEVRGVTIAPRFFSKIIEVPREIIERDRPGKENQIWYGDPEKKRDGSDGPGEVPKGKVMAFRVAFIGRPRNDDFKVHWPLGSDKVVATIPKENELLDPVNADVRYSYGIRFFDLRRVVVSLGSINAAIQLADDYIEKSVGGVLQQMSMAEALVIMKLISDSLEEEIGEVHDEYGFDIPFVSLKSIRVPHEVASARAASAAAEKLAEAVVRKSVGEKTRLTNEGEGVANAVRADLFARAEGAEKRREVASKPGGIAGMHIDAMRDALVASRAPIIVPQGESAYGLLGAYRGLEAMLPPALKQEETKGTEAPPATESVQATPVTTTTTTTAPPPRQNNDRKGKRRRK